MYTQPVFSVSILIVAAWCLVLVNRALAESGGGDQILDGIGETDLSVRYKLNGNTEDRSRNNFDAVVKGQKSTYEKDAKFGSVLSLTGGAKGPYVQIPGQVLVGPDSISVTSWVYLRSSTVEQMFFDFGQEAKQNFSCKLTSNSAGVVAAAAGGDIGMKIPRIATKKWVHITVVLDGDKKTLSFYADGKLLAHTAGANMPLEKMFNQT